MKKTANELMAEIRKNPSDDAPRLALAALLGDGHWLARLIVAQCALAKNPPQLAACESCGVEPKDGIISHKSYCGFPTTEDCGMSVAEDDPAYIKLCEEERGILDRHVLSLLTAGTPPDWYPIASVRNPDGSVFHGGWTNGDRYIMTNFHRGFPDEIVCPARDWFMYDEYLLHFPITSIAWTTRPEISKWFDLVKFVPCLMKPVYMDMNNMPPEDEIIRRLFAVKWPSIRLASFPTIGVLPTWELR